MTHHCPIHCHCFTNPSHQQCIYCPVLFNLDSIAKFVVITILIYVCTSIKIAASNVTLNLLQLVIPSPYLLTISIAAFFLSPDLLPLASAPSITITKLIANCQIFIHCLLPLPFQPLICICLH